jgi:hypothetical protein
LWGCKKEDDEQPSAEEVQQIDDALLLQEEMYELLNDLLQSGDTLSAKNQVANKIREDPMVELCGVNSQGVYIQYKSGIRGGIIIDFEDIPEDTADPGESIELMSKNFVPPPHIVPPAKRTIILNPHYDERQYFTLKVLKTYDNYFPFAAFEKPERYYGDECTVQKFAFLEDYGYVHIYSHGWAWPDRSDPMTVYLMTGEYVNNNTNFQYWTIIAKGDIPLVTIDEYSHKYFISPDFIAENNDFTDDTTLIYGGFCYSSMGNWPNIMLDAGAGAYVGFNWSVMTKWNAWWSRKLVKEMANPVRLVPLTIEKWFTSTPDIRKYYEWTNSPTGNVSIQYSGYPELALMPRKILVDLTVINEVQCDIMSTIDWTCSIPNLSFQNIRSDLSVKSFSPGNEWNYETRFTGGIKVDVSGEIKFSFDQTFTIIENFDISCTWSFKGDDEELDKYGYPRVKKQVCTGHDIPIWIHEPDFLRHIYGIQGSTAKDHLDKLECRYEFPNGSVCSIKEFDFTDETMQMIRFDFRKK